MSALRERITLIIDPSVAHPLPHPLALDRAASKADAILALLQSDEAVGRMSDLFAAQMDSIDDWETMYRKALAALLGDAP